MGCFAVTKYVLGRFRLLLAEATYVVRNFPYLFKVVFHWTVASEYTWKFSEFVFIQWEDLFGPASWIREEFLCLSLAGCCSPSFLLPLVFPLLDDHGLMTFGEAGKWFWSDEWSFSSFLCQIVGSGVSLLVVWQYFQPQFEKHSSMETELTESRHIESLYW